MGVVGVVGVGAVSDMGGSEGDIGGSVRVEYEGPAWLRTLGWRGVEGPRGGQW